MGKALENRHREFARKGYKSRHRAVDESSTYRDTVMPHA